SYLYRLYLNCLRLHRRFPSILILSTGFRKLFPRFFETSRNHLFLKILLQTARKNIPQNYP
ncbi:MAG: hypothetical protein K2P50_04870, partial [Lachnospiraceae bacterium]|nr:hypothetical protein [Lachnospiraceae bacterium]